MQEPVSRAHADAHDPNGCATRPRDGVFHVKHFRTATSLALGALFLVAGGEGTARAEGPATPQWTSALTIGGGVGNLADSPSRSAVFHLGAWSDVLFLRDSERAVGLGPYAQVATTAFSTLELSAGPTFLVPLGGPVLQFSAGPNLRAATGGPYGGVLGRIFFGSRSYNFHSIYGFAVGGFLESRVLFGGPKAQTDLVLGAQLDVIVLAMPFVFAYEAIRGPRDRR